MEEEMGFLNLVIGVVREFRDLLSSQPDEKKIHESSRVVLRRDSGLRVEIVK